MGYISQTQSFTQNQRVVTLSSDGMQIYGTRSRIPHEIASAQSMKPIETKPRLGKDEVNILEREFNKNPKPTTQVKKGFAEAMNVDLPRINNWFQNRRAKRKQEKRLKENEAALAHKTSIYLTPSPTDIDFHNEGTLNNTNDPALGDLYSATSPSLTDSSFNSELTETSGTAIGAFKLSEIAYNNDHIAHDMYYIHNSPSHVQTSSLASEESLITTQAFRNTSRESTHGIDNGNLQINMRPLTQPLSSHGNINNQLSTASNPSQSYPLNGNSMHSFNSVMHPHILQSGESISSLSPRRGVNEDNGCNLNTYENDRQSTQQPEQKFDRKIDTSKAAVYGSNFYIDTIGPPPAPSNASFRSRPPINIASRRKKVRHRPAALVANTLNNRATVGPCTVANVEGFNLSTNSTLDLPLRKIVSAGGNRAVVSGRVQKFGFEMAQRSPLTISTFESVGTFMDQTLHNACNAPPLTGLSSLSSSLPPPTPNEQSFVMPDHPTSATSIGDRSSKYTYNINGPSCYAANDEFDQNYAVLEAAQFVQSPLQPWASGNDYYEKMCAFNIADEPKSLNIQEKVEFDYHSNEPFLLSSSSQPASPVYDQLHKTNYMPGHISPMYENKSYLNQFGSENPHHVSHHFEKFLNKINNQPKQIQFSHTTPADFSEK